MEFIKLFEPIVINGKLKVENRIVLPALGLAYTQDYSFSERFKGFYRARARGGVGLMTVGPIAVDKVGSAPAIVQLFDDANVEPLREFIDEVHRDTDAKVGTQLFHMGRYSPPSSGEQPIALGDPQQAHQADPGEMTLEDIDDLQRAYLAAARRAQRRLRLHRDPRPHRRPISEFSPLAISAPTSTAARSRTGCASASS
jgi:2,4-dienoyl-CoA reductase (NADPH2)